MSQLCSLLHGRIERKFQLQAEIENLQWSLLQPGAKEEIQQEIKAKKEEIEKIEAQISALVERILRAPLCLLSLPDDSRPFLQRLGKAKAMLDELDVKAAASNPDSVDGIITEIERADELLKLDRQVRPADRALVGLFQADVLHRKKQYQDALKALEQAHRFLPEKEGIHGVVIRLMQGHIWQKRGGKQFEIPNAWGDAV
ncbi:MAG: hypothetical protein D6796_05190, partial [Caldilineae bacterium]